MNKNKDIIDTSSNLSLASPTDSQRAFASNSEDFVRVESMKMAEE